MPLSVGFNKENVMDNKKADSFAYCRKFIDFSKRVGFKPFLRPDSSLGFKNKSGKVSPVVLFPNGRVEYI